MRDRIYEVRKRMERTGIEGLFLSKRETVRYLTGFSGSSAFVVITPDEGYFLTDFRYITQAEEEIKDLNIKECKGGLGDVYSFIDGLKLGSLGFEGNDINYEQFARLEEKIKLKKLISVSEEIDALRVKKDALEVAAIKKAIEISSKAFEDAVDYIEEGKTEREIALGLEFGIKKGRAEEIPFDIIVASGVRSAMPHASISDKRLSKGDNLIIDFGSTWEGYSSDETCTLFLGKVDREQKKVFQIVKDAHDMAIEAVRPGVEASYIDSVARDKIKDAGYGEYFGHGTGHGVGLAVHEKPAISKFSGGSDVLIEEGMVFTIEPGIYIPEWGGVRIEDMVLVTSCGCEVLTYLPKELRLV
ncbi:MAG: M24 family metallopeptidase [Thermodesulfobacteriota bacterium]